MAKSLLPPRRLAGVLALCLLVLTAAPVINAQDEADPAQTAAAQGGDLFARQDYAAALIALNEALAGGLRTGHVLYQAARSQQETRKSQATYLRTITEAIPLLEAAVGGTSPTLKDHAYMAGAYVLAGNDGAALQAAARAVTSFEEGAYGSLESLSPDSLQLLGDIAILAREWDLAETVLGRVVGTDGQPNPDHAASARALSTLGQGLLAAGRPEDAAEALSRSLELVPDDSGTLRALARASFAGGNYLTAASVWKQVRMADMAMANEATYAEMIMRTLAQEEQLRRPLQPLADLSNLNKTQLEDEILALAAGMGTIAADLPPRVVQRGFGGAMMDDTSRDTLRTLRDMKLRLAWLAAEYIHRGMPIRDFAFSRGFQGYLRNWQLPKTRDKTAGEPLPMELLSPAQQQEYRENEKARAERKARKAQRKAEAEADNQP